jgi:hypothetical protein
MNPVAQELLGYSADVQGITVTDRSLAVVWPRKPDGTPFSPGEYPLTRALGGEVVRDQEMILRAPALAGGDARLSVSCAPIYGPDGSVQGAVATFKDVGDYHRLNARIQAQADELRQAAERLEQRVAERTAEPTRNCRKGRPRFATRPPSWRTSAMR